MRSLLYLILIILACLTVANLLTLGLWSMYGLDIANLVDGPDLDEGERQILRIGLMINHAGLFLAPAVIFSILVLKEELWSFLRLDASVKIPQILMWSMIILVSYPLIAKLTEWNTSVPLPEWMSSSQESTFALLEQTLNMSGPAELLTSLILVGVLAAVGEELIFRGIIQEKLNQAWENPHLAILVSSLIFGGFHMQFERIIPLSFLGLLLGYSYYYTRSLYTPIILHFINNSFQVLALYITTRNGEMPEVDNMPSVPYSVVIGSIVLTCGLIYIVTKTSNPIDEPRS